MAEGYGPGLLCETAYAKINLALHVRARRADGYHELETLFAFLDDGDRLEVTPASDLTLTVTGPFADALAGESDNLVMRAAARLRAECRVGAGAALTLDKRLPVAAGLGGGSADAAAALRLLTRFWKLSDAPLEEIARELGADVPACLLSRPVLGKGTGAELMPVPDVELRATYVLLVNPMLACPTGPVFGGWDGVDRGALDLAGWRNGRNDLTDPAIAMVSEIAEVLELLGALPDVVLTRMSGSGATSFALFDTAEVAEHGARMIADRRPAWWTMTGQLR